MKDSVLLKRLERADKEIHSAIRELESSEEKEGESKKKLLRKAENEEITDWAVKLQRSSRRGRFDELKEKGLI